MSLSSSPSEKIILALDGMNKSEALALASNLPELTWVKVGLELFINAGPSVVSDLRKMDKRVFLDLKFHDIPNTMSNACRNAAKTGAELITVHACAGSEALCKSNEAAKEGAAEINMPPPTLLAVTVLTSWKENLFQEELLINESLDKRVEHMALLAANAGIGGCICSPLEVTNLRSLYPKPFELITPGIRQKGNELSDQVRVLSAKEALIAGASRLVIGRSITNSSNPFKAFNKILNELV